MVSTNFGDVGTPMFASPPKCYMLNQGSFITDFFVKANPSLKPAQDFTFFALPPVNSSYAGSTSEKTTHFPSGLGTGAPTRFIIHIASCVSGTLFDAVCALTNSGIPKSKAMIARVETEKQLNRLLRIKHSPVG